MRFSRGRLALQAHAFKELFHAIVWGQYSAMWDEPRPKYSATKVVIWSATFAALTATSQCIYGQVRARGLHKRNPP
jgi:hypothetical protein